MDDCIFCKIIKGEIPCQKVYEDDKVFCFLDINPVNPGHTLVVPKTHSKQLLQMDDSDVAEVFQCAKKIAAAVVTGVGADGFNIGMNNEAAAGQAVWHAHVHVIPRFGNDGLRHWPGKPYQDNQAKEIQDRILKLL